MTLFSELPNILLLIVLYTLCGLTLTFGMVVRQSWSLSPVERQADPHLAARLVFHRIWRRRWLSILLQPGMFLFAFCFREMQLYK